MGSAGGTIELKVRFRPEDGPVYEMIRQANAKPRLVNRLAALGALIEQGNFRPVFSPQTTQTDEPKPKARKRPRMTGDDSGCAP